MAQALWQKNVTMIWDIGVELWAIEIPTTP